MNPVSNQRLHFASLFKRGIALAIDGGESDQALALCDEAISIGMGKACECVPRWQLRSRSPGEEFGLW